MITKASHFSIFVLDQTSAYDFYVNKLGFKVNTDAEMGPKGRWLTINPPEQPDLEITLMAIDDKMMFNAESAAKIRELVKAGTFGFNLKGAVMASDAFFPFPDCVEIAHQQGIEAVIQPGGSVKDQESINFCDQHNMAMVFTGIRHFKH